jgi:hypothetical protein
LIHKTWEKQMTKRRGTEKTRAYNPQRIRRKGDSAKNVNVLFFLGVSAFQTEDFG